MKRIALFASVLGTLAISGCGEGPAVVDVPKADRVERKPYDQMTADEKINFLNHTPMPEEAKQKQIAAIRAGKG